MPQEMEIKAFDLHTEINKHLPGDPSSDTVVHRSFSGVVVASSRQASRKGARGGFNTSIGQPYETVGEISRLTPIFKKIKEDYFDEIVHDKYIRYDDESKPTTLKKVQKLTEKHRKQVDLLKSEDDQNKEVLRSRITQSTNRLQRSRFGKSQKTGDGVVVLDSDSFVRSFEKHEHKVNKAWDALKTRERDRSFEQKMDFYTESPRTSSRRILTDHVPWGNPKNPEVPTTPENSRNYPRPTRKTTRNNTIIFNAIKSRRSFMDISYLNYPNILGVQGTSLLLQFIKDQQKNCLTTDEEIANFNEYAKKKIAEVNAPTWKTGIKKYAIEKLQNKNVPKATDLIESFFA